MEFNVFKDAKKKLYSSEYSSSLEDKLIQLSRDIYYKYKSYIDSDLLYNRLVDLKKYVDREIYKDEFTLIRLTYQLVSNGKSLCLYGADISKLDNAKMIKRVCKILHTDQENFTTDMFNLISQYVYRLLEIMI